MLTKDLDRKLTTPNSITIEGDEVVVRMPLCPNGTCSAKMEVYATTNGWLRTQFLSPYTSRPLDLQIFVGEKI